MDILKDFRKHFLVTSLLLIAIGIFLLMKPATALNLVCYALGAVIIVYGLFKMICYLMNREYSFFQYDLFTGIIALLLGVFLLVKPHVLASVLPVVLGIFLFLDGVMKLQNALDLKKSDYDKWWSILVFSLILGVLGILLLFNPFSAITTVVMVIGASLVADGIINLISTYCISKRIKEIE
ncbi:MAG: HdeD family acid-resistance protein [Lachnospiraceae bacterium]